MLKILVLRNILYITQNPHNPNHLNLECNSKSNTLRNSLKCCLIFLNLLGKDDLVGIDKLHRIFEGDFGRIIHEFL